MSNKGCFYQNIQVKALVSHKGCFYQNIQVNSFDVT